MEESKLLLVNLPTRAIDVVFHHAADLRRFYPRWVNHAMTTFSSPDVMRFLGKPAPGLEANWS